MDRPSAHTTGGKPDSEPISSAPALGLLVLYTIVYVLPFYLSPATRPSPELSRDTPSVIRARINSVMLSCCICSLVTMILLSQWAGKDLHQLAHIMGYWPVDLFDSFKCLLLTAILFSGPLFEAFVIEAGWRDWLRLEPIYDLFNSWTMWRNLVVGPVTEEILFRSAGIPLMLVSHASVGKTVFFSPVVFGLAHIHHFYEFRITQPQVPVTVAILRSIFQLTYTTLFGAYATFLFLRTGNLLAVFLVHAFCNCMGLPRFWGMVQPRNWDGSDTQDRNTTLMWTALYYVLLVSGAVSWWNNLWPLTRSPQALLEYGLL